MHEPLSIWSSINLYAEPLPTFAGTLRPAVREELDAAPPEAWPSPREWERFRTETPPFTMDESFMHRFPVVLAYAAAAAIFYFAVAAMTATSGWTNLLALGVVAAGATTPLWVQLGVRFNYLFGEPWEYHDEFARLLYMSPSAALDEYDEGLFGFLTALCMVAFTPTIFYGVARWLHPPGLGWGIAAVVAFLAATGVPLLYGLWAEARTYRNEGAARMLRAIMAGEP